MKLRLRPPTSSSFYLPLFVITLTLGTGWLIGPITITPATPVVLIPPTSARTVEIFPASNRPDPVPKRIAARHKTRPPDPERLREELNDAESNASERLAELEASRMDQETLQAQIEALRSEIAVLQTKRASLGLKRPALNQGELDEMSGLVDRRREEVDALRSNLQGIQLPPAMPVSEASKLSRAVEPSNKLPVPVELIQNRIAPVTRDFFKFPASSKRAAFVVTRQRRGETIDEAGKPGSSFGSFLTKVKSDGQYVLLLVNADSFDAFYAARELALRAGVEIAWQPADTADGTIPIVHVVQPSKGRPGEVRLPDLVQ